MELILRQKIYKRYRSIRGSTHIAIKLKLRNRIPHIHQFKKSSIPQNEKNELNCKKQLYRNKIFVLG